MRLCVTLPCFFGDADVCEAIKAVRSLGYDAVEIYGWKKLDLDEVKRVCDDEGVELLSLCTSEFRMNDPTFREAWLDGLRESCEAAVRLGAKKLITQVGQDTGEARERQHAAIVETFIAARDILASYDVTVMMEPLNLKVNHPGYYLYSSAEAFHIADEVGDPRVRVVDDIYHQQVTEGDILNSVTKNLDKIAHLHAAGHPGRIEPWLGELNYGFIFDAIDKAGYTGACGLEYRPTVGVEESLGQAIKLYGKNKIIK